MPQDKHVIDTPLWVDFDRANGTTRDTLSYLALLVPGVSGAREPASPAKVVCVCRGLGLRLYSRRFFPTASVGEMPGFQPSVNWDL